MNPYPSYERSFRPSPPVIVDKRPGMANNPIHHNPNPNPSAAMGNPMGGAMYTAPRVDKYRTVPCKYYHR